MKYNSWFSMGKKDEIQLRVPLKGDLLNKFNALKAKFGLEANTELIRLLLNKLYQETFQETQS